jgi:tetratricopeptide (TPR) repeat protein
MEQTPLELYETAYRLHYNDNQINNSIAYYQKLIKEFPDSNECGYAVIQLQKIKANNVAQDLQSITNTKNSVPLLISSIALACALLAIILFGILFIQFKRTTTTEQKRLSIALDALGKKLRGEDSEALELLNELKNIQIDNIFPYELSADIYRKQKKWDKSRNEYTVFFQRNPGRKPTSSESKYMAFEKESVIKKVPAVIPSRQLIKNNPLPPSQKRKLSAKRKRKIRKKPPPPSSKKSKGLYLVNPDSISYF